MTLNLDDLAVTSFSTAPAPGGVGQYVPDTDPVVCPYTAWLNCTRDRWCAIQGNTQDIACAID